MATLNHEIDYDTAAIMADEYGIKIEKEVVVKADEAVKSAEIMKIMNAAQQAEYKKLIVAGEPLNKKTQKVLEQQNEIIEQNQEQLEGGY